MHVFLINTFRIVTMFLLLMLLIRIQGKKQIAQFSYFNYINGIALGSLAANAVMDWDRKYFQGLLIITVWGLMTWLIAVLSLKNMTLRRLFEGRPQYVVEKGTINERNLKREYLTLEDLTSMARQKNAFALGDVEFAVIELNGSLSVQTRSEEQPLTRHDMNLQQKKIGIALPIIVDGVLLRENLQANHLTEAWVNSQIERKGWSQQDVLYMELDAGGKIKIDRKQKQ